MCAITCGIFLGRRGRSCDRRSAVAATVAATATAADDYAFNATDDDAFNATDDDAFNAADANYKLPLKLCQC